MLSVYGIFKAATVGEVVRAEVHAKLGVRDRSHREQGERCDLLGVRGARATRGRHFIGDIAERVATEWGLIANCAK
jgi:hypothetical protein